MIKPYDPHLKDLGLTLETRTQSCHDVAATKCGHQVTACTLYNLMKQAFQQSKCDTGREQRNLTFQQWREQMELLYPQFQFWSITLEMQMGYLLFLRSIRYLKFSLYVHSLDKLLPRKVDFDHYNYAQWVSVHHYDIEMLQESNSSIFLEF